MAEIRLRRYEVEEDLLPSSCMCCGEDASVHKTKTFAWHPQWVLVLILVGVLFYVVAALILTRRMTVRVPLCERHRNHFLLRAWLAYGGLGLLLLVAVLAIALLASADRGASGEALGFTVCGGGALLGLVWLIALAIMQQAGIRPVEITDRGIRLANVGDEFVEAMEDERDRLRDEEDEIGEHWKPRPKSSRDPDERFRKGKRPTNRRRPREEDEGYYDPDER